MTTETDAARDQIAKDFKAIIADTEELLKATAGAAGEKAAAARARAEETLRHARARLGEIEQTVVEKTKAAARATDHYVHENPWQAIGIAAGVGFVLGWLLNNQRR